MSAIPSNVQTTVCTQSDKQKDLGQVFSPNYIVDLILNEIGYVGEKIIEKKVMEPSFGEGAFLIRIVQRLIDICRANNIPDEKIESIVDENVYGIEIDQELYWKTVGKLNAVLDINGLNTIEWSNLSNSNTLDYEIYEKFDYVVGNPPYIRIHNISEETRSSLDQFKFSQGTTDMYILFFEKCINMLNKNGLLGFITPNSYMTNTSQKEFRKYLIQENLLQTVIDFKSYQIFEDIMTYTAITVINKQKSVFDFTYKVYEKNEQKYLTVYSTLDYDEESAGQPWNFDTEENTNLLNLIKNRSINLSKYATVQYGVATNKDALYVGSIRATSKKSKKVVFKNSFDKDIEFEIERSILKPVVKGAAYNGIIDENQMIIFPYEWEPNSKTYKVIAEEKLEKKFPLAYKYFLTYQEELSKRDLHRNTLWYEFGRSQGLNNIKYKKLVIKNVFGPDIDQMKIYELDEDVVVYSGIYITAQDQSHLEKVKHILETDEFCRYSKIVGKNMSGGYKNISTNHIKNYGINKFIGKQYFELPENFEELDAASKDNYWQEYLDNEFLTALNFSYECYLESPRSTKKTTPIHSFIAEAIQFKLGDSFVVISQGHNLSKEGTEEINIQGRYYNKNVDISVIKDGVTLGSIGVKFINSNFSQNSNNYFENMMGETANLRINNHPYSHLIILPGYLPYYNNNKICTKIEEVTDNNLEKYVKLNRENIGLFHRPDLMSVILIDTGNRGYLEEMVRTKTARDKDDFIKYLNIQYSNIDDNQNIVQEATKLYLKKHQSIYKFMNAFVSLIMANAYGK